MEGTKVYITIADPGILHELLTEGKKRKLFSTISVEKVDRLMANKTFPIQIPVELEDILGLVGSPIVKKMFGKKVEETVGMCLQKVIEAG